MPLLGPRSDAEREHLARARRRLDTLALRPSPVRLRHVRIVSVPWLFRLPWFQRFHGYACAPLILLRRPLADVSNDLVTHELTHVWQSQHGWRWLWASYVVQGYRNNPHEIEARAAVALTRHVR